MFDISLAETAIVLVVALLLIRPKDVPEIMRWTGKMLGKIRRFSKNIMDMFEEFAGETNIKEFKQQLEKEQNIVGHLVDMDGKKQELYDLKNLEDISRKK